jgi:ABC-type nitrate/sulfonate/bicarbonate transport system permease component
MYSGILLLMGMSALMYAALEIAERVFCRWRYGSRGKA